uniref:THIF-type NAD/FAD binding fold domain-containing protein n=1 Tax=Meloidogyne javanica TaxID=6303 RepID=A0A915LKF0_MELJA
MTEINKINSDEFELYDRQIRLWGLDAQNRLRQSSISDADRHSQFLIFPDDRGNRAQASIERLKQLNPMVQVNVENGPISSKSEDFFKNFDLVILVDQNFDITNKIDKICRKYKIRFQAGGVFGWIGYGFFDFNDHVFLVEAQIIQSILDDVDERIEDISESKKLRTEDGNIQTFTLEDEDVKIKKNVLFPSFEQTFDIKLGMKKLLRRQKNGDDYTKDEVIKKWKKELEEACLEESKQKFTVDDFALFTKPALNSVCAIVGSVLAQEAIKALSQNDVPLKNIFLYSPVDSSGTVCEISA